MKLMKHVKKLLTILVGILAVGLIVIIFLVSNKTEEVTNPTIAIPSNGPISALDYQSEAKQAVADYELFLQAQTSKATITTRKQHLLDLKISKEFQNLHVQLVTMADTLLSLNEGQTQEKNLADQQLREIYSQYPWLKN
jgi:hypothetical protein